MRQLSRMFSDKPMKGLSDTLLVTHLALATMVMRLRQLLMFVNMGWDCRLSSPSRVTYKPPGIPGRPRLNPFKGKHLRTQNGRACG
jgi:hypothetical protein